ncbi:type ISP restriction/modification enzyme [Gemmata massiliana]|nr:type ISP restriction/modification enzyme [Gemmata massiliana]
MRVNGRFIVPDGTLQDEYHLPRGYWEAKDTDDNLETEIEKKIEKKYPLTNTIFEDTRRAFLFQNGKETARFDLTKSSPVEDLLTTFYAFTEPDIIGFERAIEEFQARVPELGKGLATLITESHKKNKAFQTTFGDFFDLCRASLNPNIRTDAVDEMLVQHLLTERLFRKVFGDSDFVQRNVIAQKVDAVVQALVLKSFNRDEYLKPLDRFYKAIEKAAETIDDFQGKQHFLNTVYERFFQGYSVKLADTHGIVCTPQSMVDFMCSSVSEVLQNEFGTALGADGVNVLDPCTGMGNFAVNLIRRVPKKNLPRFYRNNLFANEVMLLPYYIASLNVEHAYYEETGEYEACDGLCFVDTLDLADPRQRSLELFEEKNAARVEKQKGAAITVIVGNPPYNAWQLNENDNNKNRKYEVVDERVRLTYSRDSTARNKSALSDPYVKFFRWATDRLDSRDGIVCFVSNNSFVEQIAFDGMRKQLLKDFTRIYHLHLEGNVRENPKLAGTTYNAFGIQVGVGITIAIRSKRHTDRRLYFHRIDKNLRRQEKLAWLSQRKTCSGVPWQLLKPDVRHTWLVPENEDKFAQFIPFSGASGSVTTLHPIFRLDCVGVKTNRDQVVYDHNRSALETRVKDFIEEYNGEVDRFKRAKGKINVDDFVRYDKIKWSRDLKADLKRGRDCTFSESKVRTALYRPFCKQLLFFDRIMNEEVYLFPQTFPTVASESENRVIVVSDVGYRADGFSVLMSDRVVDQHLCASVDAHRCFPFYVYDEDGSNRRDNVTDQILEQFQTRYQDDSITKWDIFHYVYGILHHPGYRAKFSNNLKKSPPRIPFAPDFRAFANAGHELAELHLNYEDSPPDLLKYETTPDVPLSYEVTEKMKLSKDKTRLWVNASLTLADIPPEAFKYRLGNRSALEWMIDQYHVIEDGGIRSDPNRPDDEEYIVRLVCQVVRISVLTFKIVEALPTEYSVPSTVTADTLS